METKEERYLRERVEADALIEKLAGKGILAIWGGGSASKGHGYWLYHSEPGAIKAWRDANGYAPIVGTIIANDGKRSGNECFTMHQDAALLA